MAKKKTRRKRRRGLASAEQTGKAVTKTVLGISGGLLLIGIVGIAAVGTLVWIFYKKASAEDATTVARQQSQFAADSAAMDARWNADVAAMKARTL